MNLKSAKTLGIVGSVISIVFSLIGVVISALMKVGLSNPEVTEIQIQDLLDRGYTLEEADATIKSLTSLSEYGTILGFVFIVIAIISLVMAILLNEKNHKVLGIFIILISVLHLFSLRLLAFVLILISGIKAVSTIANEQPPLDQPQIY